jgi:hypothetical protein
MVLTRKTPFGVIASCTERFGAMEKKMPRLQRSTNIAQSLKHRGRVDITVYGRLSEADIEEFPHLAGFARIQIFSGVASLHIDATAEDLRKVAALLIEAADTFTTAAADGGAA